MICQQSALHRPDFGCPMSARQETQHTASSSQVHHRTVGPSGVPECLVKLPDPLFVPQHQAMSARREAPVALVVEEFVKLFIEPLGTQDLALTLDITGHADDRMQSILRDYPRSLAASASVPVVAEGSAWR